MLNLKDVEYFKLSKIDAKILYKTIIRYRSQNILNTNKVFVEVHHAIPMYKCKYKKWKNNYQNKIRLLPHEHFICHWLLMHFYFDTQSIGSFCFLNNCVGMNFKFDSTNVYLASKLYEQRKLNLYNTTAKIKKLCTNICLPINYRALKSTKGMKWWTKDSESVLAYDCPGKGWKQGLGKKHVELTKQGMKNGISLIGLKDTKLHRMHKSISNTLYTYSDKSNITQKNALYNNLKKLCIRINEPTSYILEALQSYSIQNEIINDLIQDLLK